MMLSVQLVLFCGWGKLRLAGLLAVMIVVVWSGTATATSEAEPWVQLDCRLRLGNDGIDRCGLNDNCLFVLSRPTDAPNEPFRVSTDRADADEISFWLKAPRPSDRNQKYGQLTFHAHNNPHWEERVPAFLAAARQICTDDVSSLEKTFSQEVSRWIGEGANNRPSSHVLVFEPAREEILQHGRSSRGENHACYYEGVTHHGHWIAAQKRECRWGAGHSQRQEGDKATATWICLGGTLALLLVGGIVAALFIRKRRKQVSSA